MIRWWPPIGVTAMLLLGWAVGKASTPIDDWFHRLDDTPLRRFAVIADPRVLVSALVVVLVVAVAQRRWRLAVATVVAPPVGIALVQVLKPIFDREKGGGLAYPSGHIATTTIVVGLLILLVGVTWWMMTAAVATIALAMLGVGITFHYFTDVVGGLLLGSAIVCTVAVFARCDLTGVNPDATWVTTT